ncbi:MerR family transcriptional regulator [Streptomyces sp. NPDC007088]|uniref:MerR family transcriptional regulator n=1 Tax=Streptomyces sp. NPDC007088 TaxID=3364773 RepID=UPI003687A79A
MAGPPVDAAPSSPAGPVYRIEELAARAGLTVRTVRGYQDRGLLPRPERRGRANVYERAHLDRLHRISGLLERGYSLTSIKELLDAWDTGRGLGGVLGIAAEVEGPWTEEQPDRVTREELRERFGGRLDEEALEDAIGLGVLERLPGSENEFRVPSPQELAVAVELSAAGVGLRAVAEHLREVRGQVEHMASRFLEFTTEHVFARYIGDTRVDEDATAEAVALIRRLRPLAQHTVDAELARAMRIFARRQLDRVTGQDIPEATPTRHADVHIPLSTIRAVSDLVGDDGVSAFITAAAEREVQTRALQSLVANHVNKGQVAQSG